MTTRAITSAEIDVDDASRRLDATKSLRHHLRCAIGHANASGIARLTAQNDVDGTPVEDVGAYGLIHRALVLMGEEESYQHWTETNEWK